MIIQHVDGLLLCLLFQNLLFTLFKLYVYLVFVYCDCCYVMYCAWHLWVISHYLSLLKPQMPPRGANPNPNNNNNNANLEMQQLITAQTQLMQMMTRFMANQN